MVSTCNTKDAVDDFFVLVVTGKGRCTRASLLPLLPHAYCNVNLLRAATILRLISIVDALNLSSS